MFLPACDSSGLEDISMKCSLIMNRTLPIREKRAGEMQFSRFFSFNADENICVLLKKQLHAMMNYATVLK